MASIRKRPLGSTGLTVTEIGLGAMDTSQVPEGEQTLNLALDLGINFVDTAREYSGSEYLIGQIIRARGGKQFHIATKTMRRDLNGSQHDVDRSLRILDVNNIDLYQLHDISTIEAWETVMRDDGALMGLKIAQSRGLINHIGISSHNSEVIELAIESGEFATIMVEYSAFFSETNRLLELASGRNIGVIIMRPMGGSGRMSSIRSEMRTGDSEFLLTPSMLLRYVLSNPNISVAIPGARFPASVRGNVDLANNYEELDDFQKQNCQLEATRFYM